MITKEQVMEQIKVQSELVVDLAHIICEHKVVPKQLLINKLGYPDDKSLKGIPEEFVIAMLEALIQANVVRYFGPLIVWTGPEKFDTCLVEIDGDAVDKHVAGFSQPGQ